MALVKCSECKKQMSDTVTNCPKCGAPINLEKIKLNQKVNRKNTNGCLLTFLGIIIISVIYSSINSNNSKTIEEQPSTIDSTEIVLNKKLQQKQLESQKIENEKFLKTKAGKIYKKHPKWSKEDCINLSKNKIWVGMSYDMLLYLRGKPNTINTSNYGNGNEYQCCWDDYNPSCFYMKDDNIITSYN